MTSEIESLQQRLAAEGEKVASFFEALSAGAWDRQVYTTGSQWSVQHVLAHFVSAERIYLFYMRDVIDGGSGVPRDFDIDGFNESQVPALAQRPAAELLDALRQARSETVTFVGGLSSSDLDRRGYHPWFGEADLRFMLKLIYRHPMLHTRDVRKALETGAPVPPGEGYSSFARDAASPGGA